MEENDVPKEQGALISWFAKMYQNVWNHSLCGSRDFLSHLQSPALGIKHFLTLQHWKFSTRGFCYPKDLGDIWQKLLVAQVGLSF